MGKEDAVRIDSWEDVEDVEEDEWGRDDWIGEIF